MTVLLESINLLLLQLWVTRFKPLAQCVIPLYILIKAAYFNHVDSLFKAFHKKLHLLVFAIIKSTLLIRFTNPSNCSFYVTLVTDKKNFRMIAPTTFPVGVSTNWLKILLTITHIFLNFTANLTKFCGDVGFILVYQISLK